MRVFVAGATGAVGLPLVRALCTLGHRDDAGRAPISCASLAPLRPSSMLSFRQAVRDAIAAAAPDVVIDLPTSLPSMP